MSRDSAGIKQGLKLITYHSPEKKVGSWQWEARKTTLRSGLPWQSSCWDSRLPNAGGTGSIPCQGSRILHAAKKKKKTKTLRRTSFEARDSAQCFHRHSFLWVSQNPFEMGNKIPILQSIVWSCDLTRVTQHYGMEPESQIWFIHTFIQQIFLSSNCMSGSLLNIGEAGWTGQIGPCPQGT